jgi:predicted TIM-barrel fold metal-dependent hydrolase
MGCCFSKYEIIDIHTHVGRDYKTGMNQKPFELEAKLKKNKIRKAFMMPFPNPEAYAKEDSFWYNNENQYLSCCRNELLDFIPAINPKESKSIDHAFDLIKKHGLKGIKIHGLATKTSTDKIDSYITKKAANDNLPIIFHIGHGKEKGISINLESAIRLAEKNPSTYFVFAHLGRLHKSLDHALEMQNVFFDTCGLALKDSWPYFLCAEPHEILKDKKPAEIIEHLCKKGYSNKLIWASDEPYSTYSKELDYVIRANIPFEDKKRILSGNAKNLFRINQ